MSEEAAPNAREAIWFNAIFLAHQERVLAYATRRTSLLADAEDAAAETFTIAWRKRHSMPAEPLPWLFGVARRVLANQHRAKERRGRLLALLREDDAVTPERFGEDLDAPAMVALRRLSAADQELLRLVAWEDLRHDQIAVVLDTTPNAVAIRLHRARVKFTTTLEEITRATMSPTAVAFAAEAETMSANEHLKGSDPDRTSRVMKGASQRGAGRSGR